MASQPETVQVDEEEIQINSIIGMFYLFEAIKELNFNMNEPKHAKLKQILMAHYVSKLDELKKNVFVIYLENTPPGRTNDWFNSCNLMKVISDINKGEKEYKDTSNPDKKITLKYAAVKFLDFKQTGILPYIDKPAKFIDHDYNSLGRERKHEKETQIRLGDDGSISYRTFPQSYANYSDVQTMVDNRFTMLFLFDQSTYEKIMAKFSEPEFKDDPAILELLRKFNEKKQQRKTDFENGYKQIDQKAEEHKRLLTTFKVIMVDNPVSTGKGGNKRSQKKPPKRCHINSKSHYYCHTSRTQRRKKTHRR
jgi:hypothetical protein